MPDKNRRPYLNLDDYESRKPGLAQSPLETSLVRTSSRYLRAALSRESEFEKPYLGGSPRKMHLDPSAPSWPDINPIQIYTKRFDDFEGKAFASCSHCALVFDPINNCYEDWGEAHAMVWCSWQPGSGDCPDCTMQITAIVGTILEIAPGSWGDQTANINWTDVTYNPFSFSTGTTKQKLAPTRGTMSLKVKVDPDVPKHILLAEMVDGAGNYCMTTLEVECKCDCENEPPLTIDTDNSDVTIVEGGTATVTVKNGCAPYIWSISGTGYSINPLGSSDLMSATITAGTGACGTDYDSGCTVSISDDCNTATHSIRNTSADWCLTGTMAGAYNCASPPASCCWKTEIGCTEQTYTYSGNLKRYVAIRNGRCSDDHYPDGGSSWTPGVGVDKNDTPPCGLPHVCTAALTQETCANCTPGTCVITNYYVERWKCPSDPDCL